MGQRGRVVWSVVVLIGALALSLTAAAPGGAHPGGEAHHNPLPVHANERMRAFRQDDHSPDPLPAMGATPCVGGLAGTFPCSNVDLESFLPLADIGGTSPSSAANDIWGWTDPQTGREYAIIGLVFGTSFVDISVPSAPVYLGELPTHGPFGSSWRDIKVHADHAFIVSEASNHGMQVFDLTQLRGLTGSPIVTFSETAHYNSTGSAHNIVIDEDSGFAYIVGASGGTSCNGGLHMVDISAPQSPSFAGCFSSDGYTHDAQCVVYTGPDTDHHGSEICLAANEDTITIVDVTVKTSPVQLSRTSYAGSSVSYTHQGWLTEEQAHYLLDDELDELFFGHNSRTRVFDVSDLDAPILVGSHTGDSPAIDHNQYVKGNRSYQANYRSGLRILDISGVAGADLSEVGFFDVYPANDAAQFNGAWSTYPYFDSGVVVVSGIEQGLFVLRPTGVAVERPRIRPFGAVVAEGDGGQQVVNVPVYLSQPAAAPVTIDWTTVDVPANPAVAASSLDYLAASGTATFLPGETTTTVAVTVLGDTIDEPPLLYGEWLLVAFSNPSPNATLDTSFFGLGLVIIVDDD